MNVAYPGEDGSEHEITIEAGDFLNHNGTLPPLAQPFRKDLHPPPRDNRRRTQGLLTITAHLCQRCALAVEEGQR